MLPWRYAPVPLLTWSGRHLTNIAALLADHGVEIDSVDHVTIGGPAGSVDHVTIGGPAGELTG